jgi:Protein of unknown function (DUF2946)
MIGASMRWLRYDGRFGTWLALFALVLQLAVSFGHVHLEGIAGADPARVASATGGHALHAPLAPQPGTGGQDDYCPICASVYLTANSFVPAAPVLPLPSVSRLVEHFDHTAPVFVAPRRPAFQSRAPPLA